MVCSSQIRVPSACSAVWVSPRIGLSGGLFLNSMGFMCKPETMKAQTNWMRSSGSEISAACFRKELKEKSRQAACRYVIGNEILAGREILIMSWKLPSRILRPRDFRISTTTERDLSSSVRISPPSGLASPGLKWETIYKTWLRK